MTNRKRLVNYLKDKLNATPAEPLGHTKAFLHEHHIPENLFFKWLLYEVEPYGYQINSDRDVRKVLQ